MTNYRHGDIVTVYNQTLSGRPVIEGRAKILGPARWRGSRCYRVAFIGVKLGDLERDGVERDIEDGEAQTDPTNYLRKAQKAWDEQHPGMAEMLRASRPLDPTAHPCGPGRWAGFGERSPLSVGMGNSAPTTTDTMPRPTAAITALHTVSTALEALARAITKRLLAKRLTEEAEVIVRIGEQIKRAEPDRLSAKCRLAHSQCRCANAMISGAVAAGGFEYEDLDRIIVASRALTAAMFLLEDYVK